MKKHLLIMLSIISMHAYAMEMEVKSANPIIDLSILLTYPTEILNLIAQFLSFHDYETEEEFIERTKVLTIKNIPQEYRFKLAFRNINYSAYSPDNAIIAVSQKPYIPENDLVQRSPLSEPQLCIFDRRTDKIKHKNFIGIHHQKLAISNNGNMIATLYANCDFDQSTKKLIYQYALYINNFSNEKKSHDLPTFEKKSHDLPTFFELCDDHPTIAFNKQGTNIIAHGKNSQHIIFPLTVNTPDPNADHQKTLAKYFAQRGICKNLTEQISHMKCLNNK